MTGCRALLQAQRSGEYNAAMSPGGSKSDYASLAHQPFATTRWSIVLSASQKGEGEPRQALVSLCEAYWQPLYAYVRRRGYDPHEAQDLTQGFFAQLLEKDSVASADPARGKFRSFLLASLNHFLANQWRRDQAQKRGGSQTTLALDFVDGEHRLSIEPADDLTPEKAFERKWAMALLTAALSKLRSEYESAGKLSLLEHLQPYLGGERDAAPYQELADQLGMSVGAVKVAVHRLRRRLGDVLRAEIAQTVAGPEEVDDELRDLFSAVAD